MKTTIKLHHQFFGLCSSYVGRLVMSPNSSGWGVFDPVQAGKKPEISAAGQIMTELLILINKYGYVRVIHVIRQWGHAWYSLKVRLRTCKVQIRDFKGNVQWLDVWFQISVVSLPSRWAGEAAEWPASMDPPVQLWCSAGQCPSDKKHCSLQTSPSSAQKTYMRR